MLLKRGPEKEQNHVIAAVGFLARDAVDFREKFSRDANGRYGIAAYLPRLFGRNDGHSETVERPDDFGNSRTFDPTILEIGKSSSSAPQPSSSVDVVKKRPMAARHNWLMLGYSEVGKGEISWCRRCGALRDEFGISVTDVEYVAYRSPGSSSFTEKIPTCRITAATSRPPSSATDCSAPAGPGAARGPQDP